MRYLGLSGLCFNAFMKSSSHVKHVVYYETQLGLYFITVEASGYRYYCTNHLQVNMVHLSACILNEAVCWRIEIKMLYRHPGCHFLLYAYGLFSFCAVLNKLRCSYMSSYTNGGWTDWEKWQHMLMTPKTNNKRNYHYQLTICNTSFSFLMYHYRVKSWSYHRIYTNLPEMTFFILFLHIVSDVLHTQ